MIKHENINLLKKNYDENKFSHVFLIETNNKEECLNDILELIKYISCPNQYKENCSSCNICHLIITNSLPNLKVIYADGQAIKKEQMEELKNAFSHIPFISKYNVYVIYEAEKFNASSANTMLKFIEEPEDNTIGFLMTDNKENVLSTIKSRCEIVKSYYQDTIEENSKVVDTEFIKSYLKKIEIEKRDSIYYNKEIINQELEKNDIIALFKSIRNIYQDILDGHSDFHEMEELHLDTLAIIKRIRLVDDIIEKLNYNVNINLLLDDFIIRLEEL